MGCIYGIRNEVNHKWYIGQCINDVQKTRKKAHFNGHGSPLLSNDIKDYGTENFTFHIIHDGIIPELLDSYEIEAIAKYNSIDPNGYNISRGGSATRGMSGKKHTAETRRKMSEAKKGVKLSAWHCQRMSETRKGKKRKPHSLEARQRCLKRRRAQNVRRFLLNIAPKLARV